MSEIEELGILDNTIIVFTSDNGFSCGHHGFWGKGNGTFPINLYESSVKVPFIISHKGCIKADVVSDTLVSAYDFMPTLLEYLGLDNYKNKDLPGRSFAQILKGEKVSEDKHIVIMDEYGPNRMIRNNRFKYIKRYPYGPDEMYDLQNDPGERDNLVEDKDHEKIAIGLRKELQEWFLKYVNPEIDGSKEAVFGTGQKNLAGCWSKGEESHTCDDYIKESPNYIYKD